MNKGAYQFLLKINRIFNRAVKRVREENKKMGLPNVYCKNGTMYFELPNGSLTLKNPLVK